MLVVPPWFARTSRCTPCSLRSIPQECPVEESGECSDSPVTGATGIVYCRRMSGSGCGSEVISERLRGRLAATRLSVPTGAFLPVLVVADFRLCRHHSTVVPMIYCAD